MKFQQEVHRISNLNYFYNYIKKEAIFTFIESFQNSKEFMELFEDSLLSESILKIELK
jgi:hypothetical protein